MKTVVFAYHDMGCLGIEALLAAGYEISAIFTHTDNPGEKAFYGSVARLAAERGIPVYAPDDVNCNQVNHLIPTRVLVKGGEITCKILK